MTGLEQTFYIMGIVFMSLIFLMILALLAAVLVIRSKISKIHDNIERKLSALTSAAEMGGEISAIAGSAVMKKARNAMKHKKKK